MASGKEWGGGSSSWLTIAMRAINNFFCLIFFSMNFCFSSGFGLVTSVATVNAENVRSAKEINILYICICICKRI